MNIDVTVKNKVASAPSNTNIVCGNNDYTLTFLFDEEWDAESKKTARFVWFKGNKSSVEEVEFTGNTVNVPILANTHAVYVGVYAGSLRTTTAAKIVCEPSILCYGGEPAKQDSTTLARLQGLVNKLMADSLSEDEIRNIIKKYLDENPIDTGSKLAIGVVELLADRWVGGGNLYSQVVAVEGVTPYSQVDLTPSVEQLSIFRDKDLTFVSENEDGVVTVYAIGDKPLNDYTIQVTIKEVSV